MAEKMNEYKTEAGGFIDENFGFYRLYWNDILPKRYLHTGTGAFINQSDYRKEYRKYKNALTKQFKKAFYSGKSQKFPVKKQSNCFVITINFHDKNICKDSDNFETKPLTDLATGYFLSGGDKYDNCQYISLTAKGIHPHTEVYIVPFNCLNYFFQNFLPEWEP